MRLPLVQVEGISKVYPRVHRPWERMQAFSSLLLGREPQQGAEVLHDVSFEVMPGESFGIIGQNGAGKSTLLKVLTGVISPTKGTVNVRPKIAALLELGAGFQPDFSGIENVRMKASLLGITATELDKRMDEILAFADIGEYINEPVKHYSSGMVVRLGFAVVAASNPELLITDEVLAVGDESFQKKCIRWIEAFLANGNSLLMVSHSMYMVQKLCHRALWLHEGRVQMQGDVFDVTQSYLTWHETKAGVEKQVRQQEQGQSGEYRIAHFAMSGENENGQAELRTGDNLDVTMELLSPDGRPPVAAFGIVRADGSAIYGVVSDFDNAKPEPIGNRKYRFIIRFHDLPLLPGSYSVRGHAMDPEGLRFSDTAEKEFRIRGKCRELGHIRLPHQWLQGTSDIPGQDKNPQELTGE